MSEKIDKPALLRLLAIAIASMKTHTAEEFDSVVAEMERKANERKAQEAKK